MEQCHIGVQLQDECHMKQLTRKEGIQEFRALTLEIQNLLKLRTDIQFSDDDKICHHHYAKFISSYSSQQKYCCDPFKRHNKKCGTALRIVSVEQATELGVKPGQKLCTQCRLKCYSNTMETSSEEGQDVDPDFSPKRKSQAALLDKSLKQIITPVKKVGERDKIGYAKGKLKRISDAAQSTLAKELNIEPDILDIGASTSECRNCKDLEIIIDRIKEKCSEVSLREKISLLTLVPDSWTIERTMAEFKVSNYAVKKSREIRKQFGILPHPEKKFGKKLHEDVKEAVVRFYESDDYSRICPGKKDYVSVKVNEKRIHVQKRLLLCNLRELYVNFTLNADQRIGFSKFCELRPKWCVTVGPKGTHNVCVCLYHQNVKLAVHVLPENQDYKSLIAQITCSMENRNCMLMQCQQCPGLDVLKHYLHKLYAEADMEYDDTVAYKQWVCTDRTSLITQQATVEEFIEKLTKAISDLAQHHYIAKAQSKFLRDSKDNIGTGTAIILLDFAENYSFVIQDAVQGYHWDNSQASLHPFCVYFRDDSGNLCCKNYCVCSDSLTHDTNAVHAFITKVIEDLKRNAPLLCRIMYFSDGAASQYKNYKNFANLVSHNADFGIKAEWHFFATSHGKSPCDGIGGTVKRLLARASLQAPIEKQITNPAEMFMWCKQNIDNIIFMYVAKEDITSHINSLALETRYLKVKTIPGSRSHHAFVPSPDGHLQMKRLSADSTFTLIRWQTEVVQDHHNYQPGRYVACMYDNKWYIGSIIDRSEQNRDVSLKFMERVGTVLVWPRNEDRNTCWVPFEDILCIVSTPSVESSGRQYRLSSTDCERVES